MPQTLLTAATGLLAHQRKLDVVSNNIANLNTTAYKSQQALFSDLIYSQLAPGQSGNGEFQGGINPKQLGNGVQLSEISKNFTQGVLSSTGGTFDFAIDGDGFFVTAGEQQQFTRDGSFSLDSNGFLVDPSTGTYVQRTGVVGEPLDGELGFQVSGDSRITIPLGASVPGQATVISTFRGNLPASATPPHIEILTTAAPLTAAGSPASPTTLINDLDTNTTDYQAGDTIEISGTGVEGGSFFESFTVTATTTLADLITAINGNLTAAELEMTADGNMLITADEAGEALLSLNLSDGSANVGQTDFADNIFIVETDGKDADSVQSTIQIFDSRGQPHPIHVTMSKMADNQWDATFESADGSIDMIDGSIAEIIFNEDGSFQTVNGAGVDDSFIEFDVQTLNSSQRVSFDLSSLTHLATNYSATFDQDGFPPGTIASMNIGSDGTLSGVATNGSRIDIAQLAIARFSNNHGLESIGQNYFVQSANSGVASIGTGQEQGRGQVRGGQLETSNVDVALEFTQLIVAQRGFSANARSITVATEILQELNNII